MTFAPQQYKNLLKVKVDDYEVRHVYSKSVKYIYHFNLRYFAEYLKKTDLHTVLDIYRKT